MDIDYLSEKEVSKKYGFSVHWFKKQRYGKNPPRYYKLDNNVFYTVKDLDSWFLENLRVH